MACTVYSYRFIFATSIILMVLYTFGISNNNYYFQPTATRVENKTVGTAVKIDNFVQQRLNLSRNMHNDRTTITHPATTAATQESTGASVDITSRIPATPPSNSTPSAQQVLSFQHEVLHRISSEVEKEIKGLELPDNKTLEHLRMDGGGMPLQTLLIAQWRSGSSFLGEILRSHPGAYYTYEPTLFLSTGQIRNGSVADRANFILKEMFRCRYDALDKEYLEEFMKGEWFLTNNIRLLNCTSRRPACMDVDFLCKTCQAFPILAAKTVRYRLDSLSELLDDKSLKNLKVLYLVRDPRATMNSRLHLDWCVNTPECGNASILCSDLAREYHIAEELKAKYKDRFMVVRYEDLVQDHFTWTKKIFGFLRYAYTNQTQTFLESHTVKSEPDPYSTYRNTKAELTRWMSDMASNYNVVKNIQDSCQEAMRLWGYESVSEENVRLKQLSSRKS